ncbi:protein LMBR1L-like [Orbicella faveolata]|uniref:protein LMBR1L-like n=1 Tax=Orbicella faveolata TaxID=48498 RepID=UPI0009E25765|nr:protein LMBR1L-like [Orbicella faveolata]
MEANSDGDVAEQIFYDTVREYVISLLVFIILYGISHAVISTYKRRRDELDSDEEDAFVYRISFWLCTFTLTVSLGAVLLLPMSILSNEIMIMYPNSYYIKWLNGSLIHGMWNQIFLGSYMSLFVAIPFAYFFTESEGFAGSRKGIMARVYETSVVLFLLAILVTSIVWVGLALIDRGRTSDEGWITILLLFVNQTSCMAMVALNVLSLLFVHGALPRKSTVLVLGKVSSSMMGTFGALLEIILIFYLMIASLVGLYSVPYFARLRPVVRETATIKVIVNCIVLLILSSALPVLSRTLGITKFDLMGEFGRLDWLGNFRVVILYNLVFEVSTAFCLVNKFTASVRNALYEQVHVPTVQFFRRFKPKAKASD